MAKTILIVEDELAIAESIAYALRTDGFIPLHVTLGEQALAAVRAPGAPDTAPLLVVLDVGLPDMSGLEVCRRLRQFSEVPVIFLTARSDEIDRIVGLEIGADDYVTKPFSPRELVARIRVILRRVKTAPEALFSTVVPPFLPAPEALFSTVPPPFLPGPSAAFSSAPSAPCAAPSSPAPAAIAPRFVLHAEQARVVFCGQALDLTRYEYLLLKAMIAHPGHVLSRAQLMDRVWRDAPETLDRTVDAHVKSLRAKLRTIDPACEAIQTHRGMGYSLAMA